MPGSKYIHSGVEHRTYSDLPENSKLIISDAASITITGTIGSSSKIIQSGASTLHILGEVGEDVHFIISGAGKTIFEKRPPDSVLNAMRHSGVGQIIMPGGFNPVREQSGPTLSGNLIQSSGDVNRGNGGIFLSGMSTMVSISINDIDYDKISSGNGIVEVTENGHTTRYKGNSFGIQNSQLYIDGVVVTPNDSRLIKTNTPQAVEQVSVNKPPLEEARRVSAKKESDKLAESSAEEGVVAPEKPNAEISSVVKARASKPADADEAAIGPEEEAAPLKNAKNQLPEPNVQPTRAQETLSENQLLSMGENIIFSVQSSWRDFFIYGLTPQEYKILLFSLAKKEIQKENLGHMSIPVMKNKLSELALKHGYPLPKQMSEAADKGPIVPDTDAPDINERTLRGALWDITVLCEAHNTCFLTADGKSSELHHYGKDKSTLEKEITDQVNIAVARLQKIPFEKASKILDEYIYQGSFHSRIASYLKACLPPTPKPPTKQEAVQQKQSEEARGNNRHQVPEVLPRKKAKKPIIEARQSEISKTRRPAAQKKPNNTPETAIDFFERINYLIDTSKQGFTDYSVQVGSIGTLLVPGVPKDPRSNYDKETAKLIDRLSSLEELPDTFFEKPFYCPFNVLQLKNLKAQCWIEDPQSKLYQVERKLIALYEKILVKQGQVIENLLSEKEYFCKLTLENRISILELAMIKIRDQKSELDKRVKKPKFFEDKVNADDKYTVLHTLEEKLKNIKVEYEKMLHSELDPELDVFDYFQTTEKAIHEAFKFEGPALKAIKTHNNFLMKMLDNLLDFITFGFAHISTETESLITDSSLSINNRF